jgi:quercetin dioxygenase-like cupin family protein
MGLIIDANKVQPTQPRFPGVIPQPLMNADLNGTVSVAMSILNIEPGGALPAHTHPAEESFFVLEGEGLVIVNGESHPIQAEMALLASTGDVHGFTNNSNRPLRVLCIHPVGRPQSQFLEEKA